MASMLRACAQLRLSACPCHLQISYLNSHLNQFLVWRGIQPSNQINKNLGKPTIRSFHLNCCAPSGEQPSSISTATAAAANTRLTKPLETDEYYMQLALDQAQLAYKAGEVPVGAVIISPTGDVIAAAHNATERDGDPTAHAEMLCIRHATGKAKAWRLLDATMYVTLEPCPMCAGAVLQARVGRVVYGARNTLLGADGSWISMMRGRNSIKSDKIAAELRREADTAGEEKETLDDLVENMINSNGEAGGKEDCSSSIKSILQPHRPHPFHPDLQVDTGVMEYQCSALMKNFFRERRRQNNENNNAMLLTSVGDGDS